MIKIWQTKNYINGEKYCNHLIEILEKVKYDKDVVVDKLLRDQIIKIKKCQNFLAFLIGKDVIITKDYEPLGSNHSLRFYSTVDDFYQSNGNNDWRENIDLMEIDLGSYYFES